MDAALPRPRARPTPSGPRPRRTSRVRLLPQALPLRGEPARSSCGMSAPRRWRPSSSRSSRRSARRSSGTVPADLPGSRRRRRAEVVARDEHWLERARALVGDPCPVGSAEHDRVPRRRRTTLRARRPRPSRQAATTPVDRRRARSGPSARSTTAAVVVASAREAAAQRRARRRAPTRGMTSRASVSTRTRPRRPRSRPTRCSRVTPLEHPSSSRRCFGEPYLVAAPAARTTAPTGSR